MSSMPMLESIMAVLYFYKLDHSLWERNGHILLKVCLHYISHLDGLEDWFILKILSKVEISACHVAKNKFPD